MTQTTVDKEQIGHFVTYSAINLMFLALCLYLNQLIPIDEDAYALMRVTNRIFTFFFTGAFCLSWLYVFFDLIIPGSLSARVVESSYASAIFASAVLFSAVAMLFVQ